MQYWLLAFSNYLLLTDIELINNNNGTTTLRQSENFKGMLVPLFNKMLDINTVNGFNMMNRKLKELAEK